MEYIEKASASEADLVIFPEMTLTGFSMKPEQISEKIENSPSIRFFKKSAKDKHVGIIFGLCLNEPNGFSNCAVYISKLGVIDAIYRKIHPFSFAEENKYYFPGNSIETFALEGFRIELSICYDLRFPELYRFYTDSCQIVINIANWPEKRIDHWNSLLKARAIENQFIVIGVNRIGYDGNQLKYIESSEIFLPDGITSTALFKSKEMTVYEILPDIVNSYRKSFPVLEDRRKEFYNKCKMILVNKVVIVTGGAGLLGKSFCEEIIKNHGICIIADINSKAGEKTQNELQTKYSESQIYYYHLDINSKDSILELIDNLHVKFGKIDAVVNNAYPRGKNYGRQYFDVDYDDFCENININLGGYFLVGQLLAQYFIKQGFGNIINISSIYGVVAPKFEIYEGTKMTTPVEYAVIKSGLLHLTRYMAKYFKGNNIRVNAISLGGIKDAQPESFLNKYKENCLNKGMLIPQDIAGTLVFLLSDHSTFINGQNIVIDDGFTL